MLNRLKVERVLKSYMQVFCTLQMVHFNPQTERSPLFLNAISISLYKLKNNSLFSNKFVRELRCVSIIYTFQEWKCHASEMVKCNSERSSLNITGKKIAHFSG